MRAWLSPATKAKRQAHCACAVERSCDRVMRHADAGYAMAIETATTNALNLPMIAH